ncbi:hypothetical protein A2454_03480 [Candidatus Peribacteria bacterium RIFOXYC2_FULL_55_14]|nr:MAG: hypothetical protein UY85_C0030G0010 [Candidatus Peribacteria bacterium GW2011_GWB1_54_5]KKW39268.1 MAG: hypothetical protein UY87_C0050G0003 [Candidatus Peribacteria bacterium GW2011_GWC2_54_8]OGJ72191.1 MAG: hypothetical protein A2198_02070 [Candidatus Peribacteria bacterium RIFOXYA1_FULL_56_14]OGJ73560.1 MAG: hypothetical protein A2217_03650 [Candidatus Peribacteria bacterium RIFOXYA2_FULL_55_28]OGJ75764.1 MAG: hypothetical protein A2384_02205 [Candidatus Peribacteria bacterium RIFOX
MEAITQIILSLLGVIGIGGIITAYFNRLKEIEFQKLEQKQKRYKSSLLYMDAYFEPKNIKYLSSRQPDINSPKDVLEYLKAEYHEMLLYASKEVILAVKRFLENPNRANFFASVLAMRKDLWTKKVDVDIEEICIQ